jgi:hypothetical protein
LNDGKILEICFIQLLLMGEGFMNDGQDFSSMDPELLAEYCNNETKKYFRKAPYNDGYCFELLCRACRDQDEVALGFVYKTYLPILATRAQRHPQFPYSSEDDASIARIALSRFYLTVKGEKFLQMFSVLSQVIGYLYTCIHTAVLEDAKRNLQSEMAPEDMAAPEPPSALELQDLWGQEVCRILPNEQDQLLAYLRFILEMKPSEITALYPRLWASARSVSIELQTIRRHLRADARLRGLSGQDGDDRIGNTGTEGEDIDPQD